MQYNIARTERAGLGRFTIRLDTIEKNGRQYPYSYVEGKDSVAVLAKYGRKYIFIRQYRHSVKKYLAEIPGGAIDGKESRRTQPEGNCWRKQGLLLGIWFPWGVFIRQWGRLMRCASCISLNAGKNRAEA